MKGLPAIQTPRLHPQARKECASGNAAACRPLKAALRGANPTPYGGGSQSDGLLFVLPGTRPQPGAEILARRYRQRAGPVESCKPRTPAHPCIFKRPGYPVLSP